MLLPLREHSHTISPILETPISILVKFQGSTKSDFEHVCPWAQNLKKSCAQHINNVLCGFSVCHWAQGFVKP